MAEDHARARVLAGLFASTFPEADYDASSCRTNIVAFNHPQARQLVEELSNLGVEGGTVGPRRARFVTHAGVDDDDVTYVAEVSRSSSQHCVSATTFRATFPQSSPRFPGGDRDLRVG